MILMEDAMTQPTGTYATNDMEGIREDLTDIIYDISPTDTPFLSLAEHTEATARLHEWQTDALASASASNAAIEGDDAPQDSATATTRLTNRLQISTLDARVSGSGRAVDTAGRADELEYQAMKKAKELKRDMESALLDNKIKVTGNDTLASELAGIGAWIATNTSFNTAGSGSDPTAADGTDARNNGTQRDLTEAMVKEVLREAWDAGGNPDTIMCGAFNRQKVSSFTGNATAFQKSEDSTLHATFSVYESDFGELKIIPNRFMRSRDLLVLEMAKWKIPFLTGRNMVTFDLAKTGDSDARQILSEYTLEASNEAASGGVFDLNTS
jgi:hypothetical protein